MAEEKKTAKLMLVSETDLSKLEGVKLKLASEGEIPPGQKLRLAKEEAK